MASQILLAGQDITIQSDQMSPDIIDALGQSSGAGSSSLQQGRAGTVQFDAALGPVASAIGAGQPIPPGDTSVLLDGAAGYIQCPAGLKVDGYSAVSFEVWVNLSNNTFANFPRLFANVHVTPLTNHVGFIFELAPSGPPSGNFIVGNGTTGVTMPLSFVSAGTWHHLVATYDGSFLRTYVDSQLSGTLVAFSGALGAGTDQIQIGRSGDNSQFFPGSMSEAAIYPFALSQTQINTNYGNRKGLASAYRQNVLSYGPIAYYSLDEPGGPFAIDLTNNHFNATYASSGVSYGQPDFLATNPVLVRQGELIFKDALGRTIWGGFATKLTDTTTDKLGNTKSNFVTINGVDYEGQLNRILVNETYADLTDIQIIRAAMTKYAPQIDLSLLPATGQYLFPVKNFRNVSLLALLQTVAGVTGYMVWVDFAKKLHYVSPASAQTSPFGLSDTPDFSTTFPHAFATGAQAFIQDDNSAINRVTFYGGNKLSNSINQDVSPLANGSNTIFPLAFTSPQPNADGLYHATVNGVQQNVGFLNSSGPTNTCVSAGGTANALLDSGAHAIDFCVAPPSGATVILTYRYEFPLTVVVKDNNSFKFFGPPYLDGYISDSSVFDSTTAIQRCKVLLTQQSFGLTTLMIDTWQPGLISGQLIHVKNVVRGVNGTYLIQQVETEPLGAGNFVYHLTLGAWNWNLIDVIVKLAAGQALVDNSQVENTEILDVEENPANVLASVAWALGPSHTSPYYARSAALGDGHDAFPGFATISS